MESEGPLTTARNPELSKVSRTLSEMIPECKASREPLAQEGVVPNKTKSTMNEKKNSTNTP